MFFFYSYRVSNNSGKKKLNVTFNTKTWIYFNSTHRYLYSYPSYNDGWVYKQSNIYSYSANDRAWKYTQLNIYDLVFCENISYCYNFKGVMASKYIDASTAINITKLYKKCNVNKRPITINGTMYLSVSDRAVIYYNSSINFIFSFVSCIVIIIMAYIGDSIITRINSDQ